MMRGLRSVASVALVALATPLALAACSRSNSSDAHGHDHGDQGQARGGDADHGHAEDGPDPIAITRWAGGHELFVELTPPAPDREVAYAAHVTRLSDFKPVEKGSFTVRFERAGATLGQATAKTVSRAGIYIFRAKAPEAGSYELSMSYQHGDEEVTFDCGTIAVGDAPAPDPPRPGMAFLKEQQWRIPFATDWAVARAIAREVELPAVVEPAGTDRLTISAPTSGRFFHNPKLKLAEGLHIDKNALIGRIAPTVAGDDYTRLTLAVDESRLGKQQAERELKRIEPLVKDGLLPDKRIIDTRNDIERHDAQLRAARERLARVTAPQGKGGLALRSSLEGVVTEILVPNGEPVEPGQSLLRIGGEQSRWVRARFVARPDEPMLDARAVAVRTPGGKRLELEGRARLLSSHPTVDPRTQLATFIAEVSGGDHGESSHELRTGTHVVLLIQVGKKEQRLTVPKSAVVDINTRRYVFVQTGGEEFEKRRVVLGDSDGAFVHVVEGVEDGERVVTRGGYDIHLASIMGQVESHRH
jgi:multidrug efflux pump subunit AcrA (membrane-fusion protein)